MIDLKESNITKILPEYFSGQAEVQALGYAISLAIKRLLDYSKNISVYASIDSAPDKVLDMLAIELGTQYYEDSLDIEVKRLLIKGTLIWYMSAGTPSAVAELVRAVFGEGEVVEWFNYDDLPYFFKIKTNATMTPKMNEQFSAMLKRVKNTRSHIRAIEIHRTVDQIMFPAVFGGMNYKPAAIIDGYKENRDADQILYGMIAEYALMHPAAVIDGFSEKGNEVQANIYSGTPQATTEKQVAIREGLAFKSDTITQETSSGSAQGSYSKGSVIREELSFKGADIQSAIAVGVATDNGKYKNTIKE